VTAGTTPERTSSILPKATATTMTDPDTVFDEAIESQLDDL
jgi:hypothetical protein